MIDRVSLILSILLILSELFSTIPSTAVKRYNGPVRGTCLQIPMG